MWAGQVLGVAGYRCGGDCGLSVPLLTTAACELCLPVSKRSCGPEAAPAGGVWPAKSGPMPLQLSQQSCFPQTSSIEFEGLC